MSITTGSFPKALQGGKKKKRKPTAKKLRPKVSKNTGKPEMMLNKLLKGTL